MTTANDASPPTQMLNNAFTKFDRNGDGKLTGQELENFKVGKNDAWILWGKL